MWSSVEMFFEYSANFLIKDKNMDQDVLHKLVWKRVDRELENIEVRLSKKKKKEVTLLLNRHPVGIAL